MATCEKLAKCPFYQGEMKMDSGIGSMYKKRYCEGDKNQCARYQIATTVGPQFVNNSIYPNMADLAKSIIEKNRK